MPARFPSRGCRSSIVRPLPSASTGQALLRNVRSSTPSAGSRSFVGPRVRQLETQPATTKTQPEAFIRRRFCSTFPSPRSQAAPVQGDPLCNTEKRQRAGPARWLMPIMDLNGRGHKRLRGLAGERNPICGRRENRCRSTRNSTRPAPKSELERSVEPAPPDRRGDRASRRVAAS